MGLPQSNSSLIKGSWWTWNSVQITGISLNELYTITLIWQFNFRKVIILPHFGNCNHFYLFTVLGKKSIYPWMQANNLILIFKKIMIIKFLYRICIFLKKKKKRFFLKIILPPSKAIKSTNGLPRMKETKKTIKE